ncbi:MAG: hypothetical protein JKY93_05745 [Gammaproteobacteria bacterium]|nr:hypothetical protein [Gammaproteobacteria bacterium]
MNTTNLKKILIFFGLAFLPVMAVQAASVTVSGITVDGGGSITGVGNTSGGAIKYYIPLGPTEGGKTTTGTYGVGAGNASVYCSSGIGTCSDSGDGTGYYNPDTYGGYGYRDAGSANAADALKMNIYFDLSGQADAATAELDFVFYDLDLRDINDPNDFYESMSLSYWNGSNYVSMGSVISDSGDMEESTYTSASADASAIDPITWQLDLLAMGLLSGVNADESGFWVQLGFGSDYRDGIYGGNTPEYLMAALTVSPIPVPAAFWLFGSALIGFIGFSRRTNI